MYTSEETVVAMILGAMHREREAQRKQDEKDAEATESGAKSKRKAKKDQVITPAMQRAFNDL